MKPINERKSEHIDICIAEDVAPEFSYWNNIKFIHNALPEVNADEIDLTAEVFGKKLEFPFIVTAITGGFPGAAKINGNIAEACSELGIGMGIGSERAGINGIDPESYSVVKDYDIPLVIGNVGAPQLIKQHSKDRFTSEDIEKAKDLVDADLVAIHLNFLQEVVQPEGDTNAKGCFDAIRDLSEKYPIIVKETGAGISKEVASRLKGTGIRGMDIAGTGGTSFAAVEFYRAAMVGDIVHTNMGATFIDWGIPAPVSLLEARNGLPIIASGGIQDGKHVAASIAMGACCAGAANLVLEEAVESADAVKTKLITVREELRAAMLLTGCENIKQLSRARYLVLGETKEWMDALS